LELLSYFFTKSLLDSRHQSSIAVMTYLLLRRFNCKQTYNNNNYYYHYYHYEHYYCYC